MAQTAPDILPRTVLYAVELVDPVTGEVTSRGVRLEPLDADGAPLKGAAPIRNRSGRFVWLQPGATWPASLRITPSVTLPFARRVVTVARHETDPTITPGLTLPFARRVVTVAPPEKDPTITPGQAPALAAEKRLVRILLAPGPTYPFAGVTAVRGTLWETDKEGPVEGAVVQLAWSGAGAWTPAPPPFDAERTATEAVTDHNGEFAVFLPRLPADAEPDTRNGKLKVRLQVTRLVAGTAQTRWTPELADPFSLPRDGFIAQGRLFPDDLRLSWDRLSDH